MEVGVEGLLESNLGIVLFELTDDEESELAGSRVRNMDVDRGQKHETIEDK